MKTYLVTFGLDSIYCKDCVIITADDEQKVRDYIYTRYGRLNVAGIYDYYENKTLIDRYQYKVKEQIVI